VTHLAGFVVESTMQILGITGASGSGKSTLARLLKRKGWQVVDVDALARALYLPGGPAHKSLGRLFGPRVYQADGLVDRAWLGQQVFASPARLKRLNGLMFPLLRKALRGIIQEQRQAGQGKLAFDMAVLFPAQAQTLMHAVILVEAPLALRVQRLRQGRGLPLGRAKAQARSLAILPAWRRQCRLVIKNTGSSGDMSAPLSRFLSTFRGPKPSDALCRLTKKRPSASSAD
jgi:dephospho-CoA kinase